MVKSARTLHYNIKTTDRQKTYDFYVKQLGMKILRHEEFDKSCEAGCNAGGGNAWSKTQIGFGPEDENFVFEVIYNYDKNPIVHGNDYGGVVIKTEKTIQATEDPEGFPLTLENVSNVPSNPIVKVTFHVDSLVKALGFWRDLLEMCVISQTNDRAVLSFGEGQTYIELAAKGVPIKRENASGRVAFSIPENDLLPLQSRVQNFDESCIHTKLTELETPGKATVKVVVLTDPNGHEICFVGDEKFRELSKVDPKADELYKEAIKKEGCSKCNAKADELYKEAIKKEGCSKCSA
uniref:VOC domain-containing protein n=1 Tax=Panagrolaimus davidi TaxID=227884 RepID=A0A914QB11_9BILA